MPMHDWTRVSAGTYHDFHCSWLGELRNRLNEGVLPADHYAQVEQVMESMTGDLLALRETDPPEGVDAGEGGLAVAVAPPRVRITESIEMDLYSAKARHLVIRHGSDDRMVALVELVSPGNKAADYPFRTFLDKSLEVIRQGINLMVIDPFPPTPRDPKGIHAAIWAELGGTFAPPGDKPLTLAAYAAGLVKTAYVEPLAVGDALTAMPLFLKPGRYVPAPLEESYAHTFRGMPRRYRDVLEKGA
ncbi:MAG: DUF4058 domain-containing protein [Gemmataceae bacterium]|nr:DUF4058 domain-containing protein [Gemmataceae bacterium]